MNQEPEAPYGSDKVKEEEKTLTVKDWNEEDQPRERAMKYGISTLSTADLWAIILRVGLPGIPITEVCRELMKSNDNSLFRLERRTQAEIETVPGVGPAKALQVLAVMEIVRRYNRETVAEKVIISQSQTIYQVMRSDIGNLAHEEIWALFLGRRNEVICKKRITSGSAVASIFDLKGILKEALLLSAQGLVLCHNHPSGNLIPSPDDDRITRSLREAAKLLDLRMLDHVIVTANGYYSYHDSGRL